MIERRCRCLFDLDVTATFDPKAPCERKESMVATTVVIAIASGRTKLAAAIDKKRKCYPFERSLSDYDAASKRCLLGSAGAER